jgi:hypothetical protein
MDWDLILKKKAEAESEMLRIAKIQNEATNAANQAAHEIVRLQGEVDFANKLLATKDNPVAP